MFGYVQIRKPELKIKDYEVYHAFYCGLCERLRAKYGMAGRITLTYDMTFLIILLSSVYNVKCKHEKDTVLYIQLKSMKYCITGLQIIVLILIFF